MEIKEEASENIVREHLTGRTMKNGFPMKAYEPDYWLISRNIDFCI
jgi:hypothetical protein